MILNIKTKLNISFIIIFLGSVFITSEKFINTINTPKFYFTIISLLLLWVVILIKNYNSLTIFQTYNSYTLLKGLYCVGFLQSIYGILQFSGKCSSNHNSFDVTGSFENPSGFVAILTLIFPIGLYWCIKSKKMEQRLLFFSLAIIFFSIIISGSRTGIIAVIVSIMTFLIIENQAYRKIQKIKYLIFYLLLGAIMLFSSLLILYNLKSESANGRLLVWNVTIQMVKEKPLFGFGYNGFKANYMDFQAQYFEQNPQSRFKELADNVSHPFNEFINIIVNFGFVGLLLYLSLLIFIIWKCFASDYSQKSILLSCFTSFIIMSCFSYPLHYTPVWLILGYLILVLPQISLHAFNLSPLSKILIIGVSLLGIIFFGLRINYELKWKDIAIKSLQGETITMLPYYAKLYPNMKTNELFLYNYGAELNFVEKYVESNRILLECSKDFNNYDLQMILADNYYHTGKTKKAIQTYQHAANMIPCRFLPLYQIFEIYKESGNKNMATKYANEIMNKKVKIESIAINSMKEEVAEYLKEN